MRCIMMLASTFGLKCFDVVENIDGVEVVGVITPKERYELRYGGSCSKEMKNPVFHSLTMKCQKKDIPFFVMEKMNSNETIQQIKEWEPELIIVSGWYHMIGKKILGIPPKGVVGLHSSMLPKYRGGAPLVWQIINGEKNAGISLFYLAEGTDSGDIIAQKSVIIEEYDTIGTLYGKIEKQGIILLRENLPLITMDKAPRIVQTNLCNCDIYPQRNPQDGLIDWTGTCKQIYDFIRAQTKPYPGAYTYYLDYKIIIWICALMPNEYKPGAPGVIVDIKVEDGKYEPIVLTGDSKYTIIIKDVLILDKNNQEVKDMKNLFQINESFGGGWKC